jgi:iron(III) transport system ATP-binding protein
MLQQSSGITSIYVTHDQAEALAVSDEVVVINNGRIEQQGPPKSLYHFPETTFVANFIGESNVVDGTLEDVGGDRWIALGDTRIRLTENINVSAPNGPVKLSLRPEMLHIESEDPGGGSLLGTISHSAYMGPVIEYTIDTAAGNLFTRAPAYHKQYQPMDQVYLHIRPEELIVIPAASDERRNI